MHGHLPVIPPCDLLLLCGDNAPDFGPNVQGAIKQAAWYNTTFTEWLHTVQSQTGAVVFGIAGNHDFSLFRYKFALDFDIPWTYLQDSGGDYAGLKIWGSPWIHNCPGWAFNLEPAQLDQRFARVPDDTDILILHGPPYGHGDWAPIGTPHFNGGAVENVGSRSALATIERVQPQLVGFGHIHEGRGQSMVGNSRLVNASVVNNRYIPTYPPFLLTLDVPALLDAPELALLV